MQSMRAWLLGTHPRVLPAGAAARAAEEVESSWECLLANSDHLSPSRVGVAVPSLPPPPPHSEAACPTSSTSLTHFMMCW